MLAATTVRPNVQVNTQQYVSNTNVPQKRRKEFKLPEQLRYKSYVLGIILTVYGSITMIIGILGLILVYRYTFIYATAVNLWAGLFPLLAGIFGILSFKIPVNPHLMHNYYAFSLLSILSTGLQVIFGGVGFTADYFRRSIWYLIVTISLGVIGLIPSFAAMIILSHNIYCKGCCYITGESSSHPAQPASVQVFQPSVQPMGQNQVIVQSSNLPPYEVAQYTPAGPQPVTIGMVQSLPQQQQPSTQPNPNNYPNDKEFVKVSPNPTF
ncbi:uncharacterized protein TRIADDRAFT_56024 [Trichoplax adhaerens]|uniref:Uncharacterized protein n=1 Tax=Trichoplax adhaerens TaxID=10228 RepID=B3RTS0_TRIAD|nr:predicted protein [Trichoplax adhaerens]EDV26185.1 predicted protein [Trichoplax adhaerens]|eukprot:XP_002112218.1 predicted protein [Trichoplax adhaerens]